MRVMPTPPREKHGQTKWEGAPILSVLARYPQISETFVEGEIRELISHGVPVEVVALDRGVADPTRPPAAPVSLAGDNPPVRRLRAAAAVSLRRPSAVAAFLTGERAWPPPRAQRRLRGLARLAPWVPRAQQARHLHAHFATEPTDIARLLSAFTGTPFSFAAHATDAFRDPGELRDNLAGAAFCVTDCEYNRRHIAAVAPDQAHKVSVLILAADLVRFRRQRPYDPDGPVVAVGRLVPKKGFADLVAAAAGLGDQLDGREVLIVGDGPERGRLERQITTSGAPVRLLGLKGNDAIRDLLERASLSVLPCVVASDGDRDSMPVALKEAMALELPVVGTREVGIPELIGPDRGRLVPPAEPSALAATVAELLRLPVGERVAMGRAGRAFVEAHCDQRRQAERLLALIRATEGEGP